MRSSPRMRQVIAAFLSAGCVDCRRWVRIVPPGGLLALRIKRDLLMHTDEARGAREEDLRL